MGNYYLAVDIGASSGRHILSYVKDGKIELEEIYRFENGMQKRDNSLCWDLDSLFREIKEGLKVCRNLGKIPVSMGIDTWAVDYVLLDKDDNILGKTYGYRDSRTRGMDAQVYKLISKEDLYRRTGIQKQIFNTIYQLMAVKIKEPHNLEASENLLMLPDYLHFLLSGKKVSEYTNGTSTQLVNSTTKQWDYELIDILGFKKEIFKPLTIPGTSVGTFTKEIEEEVGFSCEIILPATHDTASAVMAVPTINEDTLYISSGTWSLMGIESKEALCTDESMLKNFTNEGGYDYRFRFLKNIMGLWMIQSVRHEFDDEYSFAELCQMAEEERDFPSRVNVNDNCFLAPSNMTEAIKIYCKEHGERVPETTSQVAAVIYQSLAESYSETAKEIEALTGKTFEAINIVGGGSNADYLNKLTAEKSGKTVYAGPAEATAIGNIAAQMIRAKEFKDLKETRETIYNSFEIKKYN